MLIIKNCFENKSYILFFPHFFRYWTSAEETSKLCQRVQNWEERINPILEEEEQRREFDIHRYESELLENFDKLGEDKPFYGLLRKEAPSYDISRYFLASLTLSNTGNIELISSLSSNNFTEVSNELHCKVIKLERHHEVFDDSNVSL
ncbi:unnamed protein product [Dracunculus medinensis]|uniref:Condensin-2 complex subunit H2 C-terminal domain-containing protein n=1 Tax=Dracunculus medinensis TaxID=318479 RepID=A0A3P7QMH9_DRAME|nr:unnamed protein product [Dracunculus medinensis]